MNKNIFVTGTGTDLGKTYISGLLVKQLRQKGINAGYYKAAISGAESIAESDAGYVNTVGNIRQDEESMVSYLYKTAVSPHLAAKLEGNAPDLKKIIRDYEKVADKYEFVVLEGSGGIVCPVRYDEEEKILLEDVIKAVGAETVIVADAGLGTINLTVLTVEYLKKRKIGIRGIILNNYTGNVMEKDNIYMIKELTGIDVIGTVAHGADKINIDDERILGFI